MVYFPAFHSRSARGTRDQHRSVSHSCTSLAMRVTRQPRPSLVLPDSVLTQSSPYMQPLTSVLNERDAHQLRAVGSEGPHCTYVYRCSEGLSTESWLARHSWRQEDLKSHTRSPLTAAPSWGAPRVFVECACRIGSVLTNNGTWTLSKNLVAFPKEIRPQTGS